MKIATTILSGLLLLVLGTSSVFSQQSRSGTPISNIDSAFRAAQDQAFNGHTEAARALCFQVLQKSPNYIDAEILIGRTYAWDKQYVQSRHHLTEAFKSNIKYYDAIRALIDLEYWTSRFDTSLGYCHYGLNLYPNDTNFQLMTYKNLLALNKNEAAFKVIRQLFKEHPENKNYKSLIDNQIKSDPEILKLLFNKARNAAFKGQYDQAHHICYEILDINPEYLFVRTFLGRSFSWEGKYDSARMELYKVLEQDSGNYGSINAMIDLEQWSSNYDTALGFTIYGSKLYKQDTNFFIKRARIYYFMGECEKSIKYCDIVLRKDKQNVQAKQILALARKKCRTESIDFEYLWEYWKEPVIHPFHYFSIKYAHQFPKVKLQPRLNFGDNINKYQNESLLMDSVDLQVMVDAYPQLWKGAYGFFSYAFSPKHQLFPIHRIDAEIYQKVPEASEVSLGFRYMQFVGETRPDTNMEVSDSLINVFIITGSVSHYFNKNWWFMLRPFISPSFSVGSQSLFIEVRRMFDDMDNYASIMIGFGQSPDDEFIQIGDYNNLKASRIRFGYKDLINNRVSIEARLGFGLDEYRNNKYRNVADFNLILSYPF